MQADKRINKTKPSAIFHFTMKVHGRSGGACAVRLAAYRAGERIHSKLTGRTHNYRRKTEVAWREVLTPPDAPSWMRERSALWNATDLAETRKDAQLAREIEVALPLALDLPQQVDLLQTWIGEELVARGMVVDACLHAKAGNPHCHILMTLRAISGDRFGNKVREWNNPILATQLRESWARAVNHSLEQSGFDIRVDHRSYAAQGSDRIPTLHVGRPGPINQHRASEKARANTAIAATRHQPPPAPTPAPSLATPLTKHRRRSRPAHAPVTIVPVAGWGPGPSL